MKFEKLVPSFLKEDPVHKELRKAGIITDTLQQCCVAKGLSIFLEKCQHNQQQSFLKAIIKQLEEKGSIARKLKLMGVLLQISKCSKYDVSDIVMNKKIKVFTKPGKLKPHSNHQHEYLSEIKQEQLQPYVCQQLLLPLYNYMMKLSTNEQLYNTCKGGSIPNDDIFRRGTKIRFIWIFKLYNLVNLLVPMLKAIGRIIWSEYNSKPVESQKAEGQNSKQFMEELGEILYNDMVMMNDFVVHALEEASGDNFMLMPYFDMLQFYQSMKEQAQTGKTILELYNFMHKLIPTLKPPLILSLTEEEMTEIEVQALRVKLISNTLKNPKKDHTRLETQYNVKVERKNKRQMFNTEGYDREKENVQDFKEKYKNLD